MFSTRPLWTLSAIVTQQDTIRQNTTATAGEAWGTVAALFDAARGIFPPCRPAIGKAHPAPSAPSPTCSAASMSSAGPASATPALHDGRDRRAGQPTHDLQLLEVRRGGQTDVRRSGEDARHGGRGAQWTGAATSQGDRTTHATALRWHKVRRPALPIHGRNLLLDRR
jgi:hypothetical protein